jgi:hypothetical protein
LRPDEKERPFSLNGDEAERGFALHAIPATVILAK